jgi:hypothetical protein
LNSIIFLLSSISKQCEVRSTRPHIRQRGGRPDAEFHSHLPTVTASSGVNLSSGCNNLQLQTTRSIWLCSSGTVTKYYYSNSESLSAIISYPAAITFTFSYFDTEAGFDKLTLSSCPNISCSTKTVLLDGYSGSTIPGPVTSITGVILIEWQSDATTTKTGWSAFWASGGGPHQFLCLQIRRIR